MKKLICYFSLTLIFVFSIGFFSCANSEANKELTVEEMIAVASENIQEIKNYDMTMDMELSMSSAEQTVEMATSASGTVFLNPMKMKLNMQMSILGINQEMEMYAEQDGNDINVYSKTDDSWQKDRLTAEAISNIQQYDMKESFSLYFENADNFKMIGTESINGKDAYKIEGMLSGESLETVMNSNEYSNILNSMGVDSAMLSQMYGDLEDVPVIMWVDKEKTYPVKYDMDMTAIMSKLMDNLMNNFSSEDDEEQDIKINKFFITATILNFNAAKDFEIPAEAKN